MDSTFKPSAGGLYLNSPLAKYFGTNMNLTINNTINFITSFENERLSP
jgi:hypothetical protein